MLNDFSGKEKKFYRNKRISWKTINEMGEIELETEEIFMLEEKTTELELEESIEITTETDYEQKKGKIEKSIKQISAKEKGKKYEDEVITKMRNLGMDVIKTTETTNSGQIIGDKGIDAII